MASLREYSCKYLRSARIVEDNQKKRKVSLVDLLNSNSKDFDEFIKELKVVRANVPNSGKKRMLFYAKSASNN